MYMAFQESRGLKEVRGTAWKWAFAGLNIGMVGMVGALLTLALLTGFMLGSLNKVWPWKQTVSFYENSKGQQVPLQQDNLWPWQFAEIGGQDAQLITALLLAGSGVLLVLLLERLAQRKQQNAAADGTASAEAGLPE